MSKVKSIAAGMRVGSHSTVMTGTNRPSRIFTDRDGEIGQIPEGSEGQEENEGAEVPDEEERITICPCLPAVSAEFPQRKGTGFFGAVKLFLDWILFFISLPFICMFTWTIPDCSQEHNKKYYLVSFFMAIIWIALLSFAMVTLVGRSGCILKVDKFTMGLVVVAIGTSIPVS